MRRTVVGVDLPRLGWQGATPFDRARWQPIQNRPGWPVKPYGGLWTSPLIRDGWTHWTEWCDLEEYGNPQAPTTVIVADPDALIFRIDEHIDFLEFAARYEMAGPPTVTRPMWAPVDWEMAAKEWDAVWLTTAGEHRTRFSHPGLYGWDCETVLWLRPAFSTP